MNLGMLPGILECFGPDYQFVKCTMYIIVKIGEHYWLEAVALHGALLL